MAGEPWHERILLLPGNSPGGWFVLTPDEDIYEESLWSPPLRRVLRCEGSRLPAGLGAAHGEPVYRFRAVVTMATFRRAVADAQKQKDEDEEMAPPPPLTLADDRDEEKWVSLMPDGMGKVVPTSSVDKDLIRGSVGLARGSDGVWIAVHRVAAGGKDTLMEALRLGCGAITPRPSGRGSSGGAIVEPPGDARTLAIVRKFPVVKGIGRCSLLPMSSSRRTSAIGCSRDRVPWHGGCESWLGQAQAC